VDELVVEMVSEAAAARLCATLHDQGGVVAQEANRARIELPASMRGFAQLLTRLEEALALDPESAGIVRIDGKQYLIEPRLPVETA
jgi:hypothetical protein